MALRRVRLDGSDENVLYRASRLTDLDVPPDGTRISFRTGESVSEIWVMESVMAAITPG